MVKYKIWDKQTDLYPLVGEKLTPQDVFQKWGWTENPDTVVLITEEGGVLGSIDNLDILKANYGITTDNVDEAIAQIEAILNAPPPLSTPESTPMTHADAQMLGQILTEIQLNTL